MEEDHETRRKIIRQWMALVWGFFSQEVKAGRRIFFPSSVSLSTLRLAPPLPGRS
jgi:hypothetical protein